MTTTSSFPADAIEIFDGEPRILDLRLGEALCFGRPRDIRQLIERHTEALEKLGRVCGTVPQTSEHGGRPATEYRLNEEQAVYICTKSDAPRAVAVTLEVVRAFVSMRRGGLLHGGANLVEVEAEPGDSIREQRMALEVVREARILFGHQAARRLWADLALPGAVSRDPDFRPADGPFGDTPAGDWKGALQHLLQWPMPLPEANGDAMERWIRAAAEMNGEWITARTPDEVRRALRACGLNVEPRSGAWLTVANSHPWLAACYLETPWGYGLWRRALAAAPGAEKVGPTRFGRERHQSRAVRLPLALILAP